MSRRAVVLDLWLVVLLALAFRVLWVFLLPAWLVHDEPSHFTYTMHLVEQGEVPHPGPYARDFPDKSVELQESSQTLLYHRISRKGGPLRPELAYLPVNFDYSEARNFGFVGEARMSAAGSTATPYPPLYYAIVSLGYLATYDAPLLTRLHAVRGMSALLSALSCCFGYLFALQLMKDRAWARAVGLAMGFLPAYASITSGVNNDSGMILAATVICWLWSIAFSRGALTRGVAVGLGASCGVVMLMKPSATPLVLLAGVSTLIHTWRGVSQALRARLLAFCAFIGAFVAVYGPWLVYRMTSPKFNGKRAYSQEGDVLAGILRPQYSLLDYASYLWEHGYYYYHRTFVVLTWGTFGWNELRFEPLLYDLVCAFYAASLLGLALMLWRSERRRLLAWLAAFCAVQVAFIFLFADYLIYFADSGKTPFVQGRYFYPAIAPFFLMFFLGLHELCGRRRALILTLPFLMIAVGMAGLYVVVERWYGLVLG